MSSMRRSPWLLLLAGLTAVFFGLLGEWLAALSLVLFGVVVLAILTALVFLLLSGSGGAEEPWILFYLAALLATVTFVRHSDLPRWAALVVLTISGAFLGFLRPRLLELARQRQLGRP